MLAQGLLAQRRAAEAVAQWRVAMEHTRAWAARAGPGGDAAWRGQVLGGALVNQAAALSAAGAERESEDALREAITWLERSHAASPGPPSAQALAVALYNRANGLMAGGRPAEAQPLLARALALREQALGDEHPLTNNTRMNLAAAQRQLGRLDLAEALHRRVAASWERGKGALHGDTLFAWEMVAGDLALRGDLPGAERLQRDLLGRYERLQPFDAGWLAQAQYALAHNLARQGRAADALPLADAAAQALQALHGAGSPAASQALQLAGQLHGQQRDLAGAVRRLRPACQGFGTQDRRAERAGAVGAESAFSAARRASCSALLSATLVTWAASDGDDPAGLRREALLAAQDAMNSSAGTALSRSGARALAAQAGLGDAAEAYERALDDVQSRERAWAEAQRPGAAADAARREPLLREVMQARERQAQAARALEERSPAYWDLRSPRPLPLAELQRHGPQPLLRDDEALVLWLQSPELRRGVVFAISPRAMASARIDLDTAELDGLVRRLREQIDPCAWGLGSADCRGPDSGQRRDFDLEAAWRLHRALLGDAEVARVLSDPAVKTLLVVPSGSLTTLPPGVLLSAPPRADAALAEQPWLLRDKAVALLPTVSALRTLRQQPAPPPPDGAVPLFMLADPDFSGAGTRAPARPAARAVPRAAAEYLGDGQARRDALARLPQLPGTAAEAALLRRLLDAREADVLLGSQAREAMLRERVRSLSRARVVAFATHGLVTGELGAAEPGLALAAPQRAEADAGDDGVLSASEVARLRLRADWVLLSACNTAAPDAHSAQGLSGLARAFFHAGARSLLVSHWRVDDDATQALIGHALATRREGMAKAEALRQASLAILRGEGIQVRDPAEREDLQARRAHPAAWAAFTLVGEPR
jgi:CHAT domain-containing protein/tetratricopeptide (TPR) repeat protein